MESCINPKENANLIEEIPFENEILEAIKKLRPLKVPGPIVSLEGFTGRTRVL